MTVLYHFGAEMKRPVNGPARIPLGMAYDPGALNASLAAAVGTDSELMTELRTAFIESAVRQLDLMGRSRCDANWVIASSRLKSLAASFGAAGLVVLLGRPLVDGIPHRSS